MEVRKDLPVTKMWHAMSTETLAVDLHTNLDTGLSREDATFRQQREGYNELPEAPPPSLLKLFLSQFANVIVWVLIGAAGVSGLLEDWLDAAAILTIVGYSVDDPADKAKAFATEYKMNYPVLLGEGREDVQDAFGPIWGIPASFVSRASPSPNAFSIRRTAVDSSRSTSGHARLR